MLILENISKKIRIGDKEIEILKNINIEIEDGEMVAICGKSGCGKSTLLGTMSGIDKPTTGSVYYNGDDIYSLSDTKLAQMRNLHFGIIFQDYQLIPELTVLENIEVPLLLRNTDKKKKQNLIEVLQKVDLQENMNTKVSLLSGGEQQRVAIARALVQQPSIIFADEPTGALDFENSCAVMDLLLMIKKELKVSIVLVTHDRSVAENADRIIEMDYGIIK